MQCGIDHRLHCHSSNIILDLLTGSLCLGHSAKYRQSFCMKANTCFNNVEQSMEGVVGWCEGAVYLTSLGRPTDIGLQLGKACYLCSG